jgi:ribosomal peptide maturation radical SAM protein 1
MLKVLSPAVEHARVTNQEKCQGAPVALVCMPWGAIQTPSLAMAILKSLTRTAGFKPELHFLNMRFAEMLGLREYEAISTVSYFHAEWFFSQALFGPQGLKELANDWETLRDTEPTQELVKALITLSGRSEEHCAAIANHYVPRFVDACVSEIDWGNYMAVGFTTTFAQSAASLLLARRIKERWPHVKIIFGGANVDGEMGVEFLHGFDWIDYVVHGEAEISFPLLLKQIAHGTKQRIGGVSWREGEEVFRGDQNAFGLSDLNQSPVPDYSDYIDQLERSGFRRKVPLSLYYESSRGCWWGAKHHCTFCGLNGSTMAFRSKTSSRVYSEIVELSDKYRCLKLNAADNILAMDHIAKLLPQLAEMDCDIELFYEVKANLTRQHLKTLWAAGVKRIQPGVESFSSPLLKLMRKGVTAIQNIQLLKWCRELGIEPIYNVLYGFPGETPDQYSDLPDLFRILSHLRPPGTVCPVFFERFSPYHFEKERFGLTLWPNPIYRYIFPDCRVQLDKIAYFFAGKWQGQVADPEEYIAPALTAWKEWQALEKAGVFCCYVKGPNYITIYDNRPQRDAQPGIIRSIQLDERTSAIYLFCDENRTMRAVTEMLNARFATSFDVSEVQVWLDDLVHRDLMFREGDRYLSLAVRGRPILRKAQ